MKHLNHCVYDFSSHHLVCFQHFWLRFGAKRPKTKQNVCFSSVFEHFVTVTTFRSVRSGFRGAPVCRRFTVIVQKWTWWMKPVCLIPSPCWANEVIQQHEPRPHHWSWSFFSASLSNDISLTEFLPKTLRAERQKFCCWNQSFSLSVRFKLKFISCSSDVTDGG